MPAKGQQQKGAAEKLGGCEHSTQQANWLLAYGL